MQVHHIDENPANNALNNLSVLCFDCHTETQIKGGFHRKLNAEQVILYRDDWLSLVARGRARNTNRTSESYPDVQAIDLELATSIAEIYRENEEYELLALHYLGVGNDDLRDKYIELATQQGLDDWTLIFFRSIQNRLDLVPAEAIARQVAYLEERSDWFSLGRLYRLLGDYPMAAQSTSKGVVEAIENGNVFTAAFHLQEMIEDEVLEELFVIAMEKARKQNSLWWQYRCLEELGWDSEAQQFLLEHREEIEASGEPHFIEPLSLALGDTTRYVELRKEEANASSAKPLPEES